MKTDIKLVARQVALEWVSHMEALEMSSPWEDACFHRFIANAIMAKARQAYNPVWAKTIEYAAEEFDLIGGTG